VLAALVDVDGTVLEGPSSERLFVSYLLRTRQLGPRQLAAAMAFYALWWPWYGRQVSKKNKAYLAGLPVSEVEKTAAEFVQRHLMSRLRPSMLARIASHRQAKQPVAFLTGTPDFIARPLAAELGVVELSATRCAQSNEVFMGCPPTVHPFGEEKLPAARALCAALGVHLEECVAYADSFFDLPLLERVGLPVAVQPDRRLRLQAVRRNWEILDR
jgi:HAD superfamily phosphoserine phosphatase-like hydrolase